MENNQAPLSERLRALVVDMASEATLTCEFEPGGRLHGVGIRANFYCARCGEARHWHQVAEAALLAAAVENGAQLLAAAEDPR